MAQSKMPRIAMALLASVVLAFTAACGVGKDKGEESASPSESKSVEATQSEEPETPEAKGNVLEPDSCLTPLNAYSACQFTNPEDVPIKVQPIFGLFDADGKDISMHEKEAGMSILTVAPGQTFTYVIQGSLTDGHYTSDVAEVKNKATYELAEGEPVWDGTIEITDIQGWTGNDDDDLPRMTLTVRPTDPAVNGPELRIYTVCKNDQDMFGVSDTTVWLTGKPEYVQGDVGLAVNYKKSGEQGPTNCETFGVFHKLPKK
ncbi:MAG: hypothetical protein Q4G30_01505 [Actinomycetaceae bacterium]|nr:hypothetical protein [Actinomycetaceae bacterium]